MFDLSRLVVGVAMLYRMVRRGNNSVLVRRPSPNLLPRSSTSLLHAGLYAYGWDCCAYLGESESLLVVGPLSLEVSGDGGVGLDSGDLEGDARGGLGLDLERGSGEGVVSVEQVTRRLANILEEATTETNVSEREGDRRSEGVREREGWEGKLGRWNQKEARPGRTRHAGGTA